MHGLSPIASNLWTEEAEPRLIGGRRKSDGVIVFPFPEGNAGLNYDAVPLSRTGTLWSWTIQTFRPKSPPYDGPEAFEPFAVGYVELPGEVIVETRITRAEGLKIGMPMELAIISFDATRSTYAFKPVEGAR